MYKRRRTEIWVRDGDDEDRVFAHVHLWFIHVDHDPQIGRWAWQDVQSDRFYRNRIDPNPANDALSLTLNVGPAPAIPPILRVRKVRTGFFDRTPIAEIEIDQAALDRLVPFTTFSLEGSSNLRDWEFLKYVGLTPLAPVTFIDHAPGGVRARAYRLRTF